jgi:pSer/pThr/pTyr-binding forkhead associated (FHA) protein
VPGKTFLLEKEEASVGRDLGNDIPISDPEISRRHARFFKQEDNFFIEDLGSTNGTFLNGERISSPQQLRKGDLLTFGESVVLVYDKLVEAAEATVVSPPVESSFAREYTPPTPQPQYVPEEELEDNEPWVYKQTDYAVSVEQEAQEYVPPVKKKKAKGGMPTWMIILLIAIVVFMCVITVTMYFMPASWWCAITFDSLAGCPVP